MLMGVDYIDEGMQMRSEGSDKSCEPPIWGVVVGGTVGA